MKSSCEPHSADPAYGIAFVLLAVFALGILRAYVLIGARRGGSPNWLGPRFYTELPSAKRPPLPLPLMITTTLALPTTCSTGLLVLTDIM